MPPALAVGTDLMYSVPTKLLAAVVHARQRTIDRRVTAALAIGGVPGVLTGLGVFAALRAHVAAGMLQQVLRHAIGVAILCACLAMVATYALRERVATRRALSDRGARTRAVTIGFVVGALVAVTSIGSGSVTLPLLMLALPAVAVRRLIGSEIAFAAIVVPVAALGHTGFGDVDWRITGSLLAGSLPGVYLGSRLCVKVDERPLRAAVMVILAYAAYRLL